MSALVREGGMLGERKMEQREKRRTEKNRLKVTEIQLQTLEMGCHEENVWSSELAHSRGVPSRAAPQLQHKGRLSEQKVEQRKRNGKNKENSMREADTQA